MAEHLYNLVPTDDELVWRMPIVPEVCVGSVTTEPFMFGGLGLAASIGAMERVTGRPLIWASAQYLSFARIGEELTMTVQVPVTGRSVSHARVAGRVGDREVISVVGSLGGRGGPDEMQWSHAPDIGRPDECEEVNLFAMQGPIPKLGQRMRVRMPAGQLEAHRERGVPSETGKVSFWMTMADGFPTDVSALALFADQVPGALGMAMGRHGGGNSLDNTLRIVRRVPTKWVLCEIDAHGVDDGIGHGDIHMYAETGELLAVGSQSCVMRFM